MGGGEADPGERPAVVGSQPHVQTAVREKGKGEAAGVVGLDGALAAGKGDLAEVNKLAKVDTVLLDRGTGEIERCHRFLLVLAGAQAPAVMVEV
jgi:hypothetical protein